MFSRQHKRASGKSGVVMRVPPAEVLRKLVSGPSPGAWRRAHLARIYGQLADIMFEGKWIGGRLW